MREKWYRFNVMEDRKAIKVLRSLKPEEWKRFRQFVHSPYYNESKIILRLVQWLHKYYPEFTGRRFTEVYAYQAAFETDYKEDSRIKKLFSSLYALIEQFITVEVLAGDKDAKFIHQMAQLRFHQDRKHNKLVQRKEKQLLQYLQDWPVKNHSWYENQYQFQSWRAKYQSEFDNRQGDINLEESSNALDKHYLLSKLMMLCLQSNRESIVRIQYPKPMLQSVRQMLQHENFSSEPAMQTYLAALELLDRPDHTRFQQLKLRLKEMKGRLEQEELHALYAYLSNTCKAVFGTASPEYFQERFEIEQRCLENGLLYHNGKLLDQSFKNMVVLCIRNGEFEYARNFVKNEAANLKENNRSNVVNLCNALISFNLSDFETSQELLAQVNHKDLYYALSAKRLQAMIYFEKQEWSALESLCGALKVYVHRRKEKLPASSFEGNAQFATLLLRLLKLKQDPDSSSLDFDALMKQISENKSISERTWLSKKLLQN